MPRSPRIPPIPLALALAGLIPFAWGALSYLSPGLSAWGLQTFGARFVGPYVQLFYGSVILSFMSGVLWGFATRAPAGRAGICYALSVLPALWAFVMTGGGPTSAGMNLIFGFAGVLLIDAAFSAWGLTPGWWLRLRVAMTALVIACLSVGVIW
ncbi:DUF3429 domain-containing protein [Marinibacterium sp. SX1]|uniref:DUF3429 domain-containing protein n=1 Tax=Marinibacterium sp. SX1 TaxID=3388424 RepID=UPI003D17AF32